VLAGARVGESFVDPRRRDQKAEATDLQGQTLKLVLSRLNPEGKVVNRTVRLRVAGVLAERGGQDDYSVFLALPDLQELNTWVTGQRPNPARDGYMQVTIVMESAERVLPFQQELLTRGFFAFSASGTLQQINILFLIIQAIMGGVGGIALLVAGIGIANTLTMAILERTREIGLMKAVGATNRDVMSVFLAEAGGIGLAPLRPVLYRVLAQREKFGKVVLLYGTRSPEDILFRRELEQWRASFELDVHVTVDRAVGRWRGNVGVVTTLIPRAPFDPLSTLAVVCGPEVMMRFTALELLKRGVAREHIYLSMERNMKCGIGLCGHCQFGPTFVCKDGPVFRYDRIEAFFGKREL